MPNIFAYIVLFGWPLVVFMFFRRLTPAAALGWSILAGYLLLPTKASLDLPGFPAINKDGVPVLTAGLVLLLGLGGATLGSRRALAEQPTRPQAVKSGKLGQLLVTTLLVLLLVSAGLTVLTNPDPIFFGPLALPGLRLYDGVSIIGGIAISIFPFLLARRYLCSPESHVILLKILVLSMVGYSLPILYEIRMSPQLNAMFYGFFPHEFLQHVRADGFRPIVFLYHGLWLAILLAMSIIAALALWRQRLSEGARAGQWLLVAIFLLVILYLCKSLGALAIALLLMPAILLLGVRGQLMVAAVVSGVVLLYPMLRAADMVPIDAIMNVAERVSEERADSFAFRVANEDALLDRAALRPVAGWGTWGRPMIFDPETGRNTSVSDGAWIIAIGTFGWLGYIASFGLLTLPILLLTLHKKQLRLDPATSGLAMVMATNLIDLLPNATLTPITWLIGGALIGRYFYRPPVSGDDAAEPSSRGSLSPRRSWDIVSDTPTASTGSAPQNHVRRRVRQP